VFEVELEVVDLEGGEEADAALEHFEAGEAAAAEVEIIAAKGEGGGVGDFEAGEGGAGLGEDLAEGLEGVEEAGGVGGGEGEAVGGDAEGVGFGGAGGAGEGEGGVLLAAGDVVEAGEKLMQGFADARVEGVGDAGGGGDGEGAGAGEEAEGGWGWQELEHGDQAVRGWRVAGDGRGANWFTHGRSPWGSRTGAGAGVFHGMVRQLPDP
jgi:hypothetical protein